mmetsp:Transcript_74043/g.176293  ORF Transcript_74043/g.176293 Transcript_74043/m.176293 type:complete len:90 (-) Transcript_74043:268-537(-)
MSPSPSTSAATAVKGDRKPSPPPTNVGPEKDTFCQPPSGGASAYEAEKEALLSCRMCEGGEECPASPAQPDEGDKEWCEEATSKRSCRT